jgi:hypothetical protein
MHKLHLTDCPCIGPHNARRLGYKIIRENGMLFGIPDMNSTQREEARKTCQASLSQPERLSIPEGRAIAEELKAKGLLRFNRSSPAVARGVLDRKYDRSRRQSNYAHS